METTDLARAIGALEGRLSAVADLMQRQNDLTLQAMKEAREDRRETADKLETQGKTLSAVAIRVDGLDQRVAKIEPVAARARYLENVGSGAILATGALLGAVWAVANFVKPWVLATMGLAG